MPAEKNKKKNYMPSSGSFHLALKSVRTYAAATLDYKCVLHILNSRAERTDHSPHNTNPTDLPDPIKGRRCDPSI